MYVSVQNISVILKFLGNTKTRSREEIRSDDNSDWEYPGQERSAFNLFDFDGWLVYVAILITYTVKNMICVEGEKRKMFNFSVHLRKFKTLKFLQMEFMSSFICNVGEPPYMHNMSTIMLTKSVDIGLLWAADYF